MVERSKCMNVPEIRFKEFCDYYSDILLEKCLSVSNKKNNKLEYKKEDALSVSDEFGVVNQIEHLGRSYTGYNISTYKILNKGQIVYTKSPLKLKPFGIIKVNKNILSRQAALICFSFSRRWVWREICLSRLQK